MYFLAHFLDLSQRYNYPSRSRCRTGARRARGARRAGASGLPHGCARRGPCADAAARRVDQVRSSRLPASLRPRALIPRAPIPSGLNKLIFPSDFPIKLLRPRQGGGDARGLRGLSQPDVQRGDRGGRRARSHCRFVLPLIHFIPYSLTYLLPLCLTMRPNPRRAPTHSSRHAACTAAGRPACTC
jgi:hypothetical protein